MGGAKRKHHEAMMVGEGEKSSSGGIADSTPSRFMPMFEQFRAELDEHHDRRERIIKASRDVTAASKKIIFTLQRVRQLDAALPPGVAKGNKQYHDVISAQFSSVSRDLQGLNAHRYARQISGGCQEWMEAASFEHYLTTASLISYDEAVERLRSLDSEGPGVALSVDDYLLGIYDMTGELMRFAITAMATSGALPVLGPAAASDADAAVSGGGAEAEPPQARRTLLTDMRALRAALESLEIGAGPLGRDVDKKADVMRASVEKVERALYGLIVRGAERPKGWMPDTDAAGSRTLEVEG